MKTQLIKIGNSHGIRIPKALIEQLGLGPEVDVVIRKDALVIRSHKRPRAGWAEAFAAMHAHGDDQLLDRETSSRWDEQEWEW
jgi:antitoxin MazE